jgi:uncharacterized protein (DUF1800 family)
MGDANTVLNANEARHHFRRTGFGAPKEEVARILSRGETRAEAANRLLSFTPSSFRPRGRSIEDAHNKWIKYLLMTNLELQEKLVIFWHDHFATSNDVVGYPKIMGNQNYLLRSFSKGNFKDFVKAINKDAAMMEMLDTVRNRKRVPNENYARELLELFTLGVTDLAGNPNYDQEDIVQIARAFTGWSYNYKNGDSHFHPEDHDYMEDYPTRGAKTIFKTRGGFGPAGRSFAPPEGEAEIDAVIDIIFEHTDSEGKSTVARHIAYKLLSYFAHANPDTSVVDDVVFASGFDDTWSLRDLLFQIFVHDAFYETAAPAPFGASTKKSIRWPIDFVVSTARLLGMKFKGRYQYVDGGSYATVRDQLANMGQMLFQPPSVFGWDWELAWLSSATLLARYNYARDLTSARGAGSSAFRADRLVDLDLTDPGEIVDAVTDALGVTVLQNGTRVGDITEGERNALIAYLSDNGANPTLDLNDYDVRNEKLHGLFALVLESPAYQLH